MKITWKRREAGSYQAELNGTRVVIVNMHGEAVRYGGPGTHWLVREGGHGEYDLGSTVVHAAFTFADAKHWAEEQYTPSSNR